MIELHTCDKIEVGQPTSKGHPHDVGLDATKQMVIEVLKIVVLKKVMAERQSEKVIRVTDGREEYTSTKFGSFYEKLGIQHETTTQYNPRHNGLAKMRNTIVLNIARSIFLRKRVRGVIEVVYCSTKL
ncbi:hypothetical protein CR513_33742, partial [Mucuna pruriens]